MDDTNYGASAEDFAPTPRDRESLNPVVDALRTMSGDKIKPALIPLVVRLLRDPGVNPDALSPIGWLLMRRELPPLQCAESDQDLASLAERLSRSELSLTLLRESPVHDRAAERTLTRMRRWMAVSGRWPDFDALTGALATQSVLNGGAWPFDEEESGLLQRAPVELRELYLPLGELDSPDGLAASDFPDPVTAIVARHYEIWPYPVWRRLTLPVPRTLRDLAQRLRASPLMNRDVLIAGCGTGKEAVSFALRYPEARVTAIDISEASLNYARRRAVEMDLGAIRFLRMDLRDVSDLDQRFDVICCSGVLHHLADPESGWETLVSVLSPGGAMSLLLYSRIGRLAVDGARRLVRDILAQPLTDDRLRIIRQRILAYPVQEALAPVVESRDFSSLAGTYDLIAHRHEDCFDIPRINRVLDRLRLQLLSFEIGPGCDGRYESEFPEDPLHQNLDALARFEASNPLAFTGSYRFWCQNRK